MEPQERRASKRVEAIILVELSKDGRTGVSRDMSLRGLKVATRAELVVGEELEITIHAKAGAIATKARVVRVEKSPETEAWPYHVAMALDADLPGSVIEEGEVAASRFGTGRPAD